MFDLFAHTFTRRKKFSANYSPPKEPRADWGNSIAFDIKSHLEPNILAERIDFETRIAFTRIPYTAWIWFALGYKDTATCCFLDTISNIRDNLSRDYRQIFGSKELNKAELVVKDAVQPFLRPIFDIFANPDLDLVSVVIRLEILNLRFRREFVHINDVNWSKSLSTDFSILDILEQKDSETAAKSLTLTDLISFDLNINDIYNLDRSLKEIRKQWDILHYDVVDCITVDRRYISSIVEITKDLLSLRNYNSATSLIMGLQTVKNFLDDFPEFQQIIDLYGGYQIHQFKYPGIPWIIPLTEELHNTKQTYMFCFSSWTSNVRDRVGSGKIDEKLHLQGVEAESSRDGC
ncbi:hypothetical protein ACMFMG_012131 [Clarireedia jacksonii]